ncbi:MAG: hypothetical protein M1820_005728 [Bogoriella megaspora]|nr:MAG: hypothetical protein M1820_005728 [Bogoriella megaspora]
MSVDHPTEQSMNVQLHYSVMLRSLALAQEISPLPSDCSPVQSNAAYPTSTKLPDPFLLSNGARLSSKDAWECKRAEIRDQIQRYELGPKPPKPTVKATFSGNSISITCTEGGTSISFSVSVSKPTGGKAPYPALIAYGAPSIPVPSGVATINYNNQDIAADNPRGQGKFYTLYGSSNTAGGLIAWAWGASRIIDALEQLGSDVTGIDATRLAVTGCSRNGKGALIAAAFDDRFALALPQEGGSGGPGCRRIVAEMKKNGTVVEDATQIVTGDGWFAQVFSNYAPNVSVLPYDHHMLEALVAPRGLLVIENSGIDYLGPISTYGCSFAGREVFQALGAQTNMGFSQVSHGSTHCQMPSSQNPEVAAFFGKFLLSQTTANTNVFKTDGTFNFEPGRWIAWNVPSLA